MKEELTVESLRENGAGKTLPEEQLNLFHAGYEEERMIPVRSGTAHIYYYAPAKEGKFPLFINLHGGGFIKGHRDQDTVFCRNIVENSGYCVVDIDYHTAPEKKYPYALEESYDVVKHIYAHPEDFHADLEKVVIAGHSAGGNLVAGIQFLAQREKAFQPSLLILDYPPLDFLTDPEDQRYVHAPDMRIPVDRARKYNEWYIDPERVYEVTASPVVASKADLSGFPPTVMIFAERDSLTEAGIHFAAKLMDAGVTVFAKRVKGTAHGFTVRRAEGFEIAEKMIFDSLELLKKGGLIK